MSKLSLYQPGKTKDYRFLDNIIGQHFNISGTLIYCHKYLGPAFQGADKGATQDTSSIISELSIQDLLLLENRDRTYEKNIIELQGNYTVSDLDFNLSQFGIFQNSSVLFINFHINQTIDKLGRKLIPGDVLEIVHRRDEVVLDPSIPYIPAFYVIQDTSKAAEGYSATWNPHIWRVRAEPLTDSQEYKQLMDSNTKKGFSLEDLISTYKNNKKITDSIQKEGDEDVPTRNFNSDNLFIQTSGQPLIGDNLIQWPFNNDGTGLNMDTVAPKGTRWPENPVLGDYYIRTDYQPPRLFQRTASGWTALEDVWRDRAWTPASRALEDQLESQTVTVMSGEPLDQFFERQPISNAIPLKTNLPKQSNELTPEEQEDDN